MKNLVNVIKSKVWFNCLSGYMGLDHPQRLFLCSCVERRVFFVVFFN